MNGFIHVFSCSPIEISNNKICVVFTLKKPTISKKKNNCRYFFLFYRPIIGFDNTEYQGYAEIRYEKYGVFCEKYSYDFVHARSLFFII